MDIKVSSDTVTKITSSKEFVGEAGVSPPPSAEDMIESIRQKFRDDEARFENLVTAANDNVSPEGVNENTNKNAPKIKSALKFVRRQQQRFEELLTEVPEGFRLTPVFYNRVDQETIAQIQAEYEYSVRPRFLRFLAEHHAEDLKKLGICDNGIARMKKGLDPADINGQLYHTSVDHIIEKSGCGLWSESKVTDPHQPSQASPKYRTNHFGNLIFLPEQVHSFKNELNNLQQLTETTPGEGRWALMMVPVRDNLHAGFVCPPQPKNHKLHGVNFRTNDLDRQIGHAAFTAQQALAAIHPLKKNELVKSLVATLDGIARRHKTTVAGLSRRELRAAGVKPGPGLAQIFNDVAAYDPHAHAQIHNALAPALSEAAVQLKSVFDRFSGLDKEAKATQGLYRSFLKVYNGKNIQRLREDSALLPLKEAVVLQDVLAEIDRAVARAEKAGLGNLPLKKEVVKHKLTEQEMGIERPQQPLRPPYGPFRKKG